MKKIMHRIVITFFLIVGVGSLAHTFAAVKVHFYGRVTGSNGRPIANANVIIWTNSTRALPHSVKTDSDGRYDITNVEIPEGDGNYLTHGAHGYSTLRVALETRSTSGSTIHKQVDIELMSGVPGETFLWGTLYVHNRPSQKVKMNKYLIMEEKRKYLLA